MENPKLTIADFASRIRSKYPGEYDELKDADLVGRIVAKYPEYKDQIDFSPEANAAAVANKPRNFMDSVVKGVAEYGPMTLGAVGGGVAGAPLGPMGSIAGAGLGAGLARSGQNALNTALGQPAPKGFAGSAVDVGKNVLMGMAGEIPGAAALKMYPGATMRAGAEGAGLDLAGLPQATKGAPSIPQPAMMSNMSTANARRIAAAGPSMLENQQQALTGQLLSPLDEAIGKAKFIRQQEDAILTRRLENQQLQVTAEKSAGGTIAANTKAADRFAIVKLRQERTAALENIKAQATGDARKWAEGQGVKIDVLKMKADATAARQAAVKLFEDEITKGYNGIRETIAKNPANVTMLEKPLPTLAEARETLSSASGSGGNFGISLNPAVQTAPETVSYNGIVELHRSPRILAEYAKPSVQSDISAALRSTTPEARLITKYVEGAEHTDIATLIDDLAVMNRLRNWKRDPAFKDNGQRLAGMLAEQMSKDLDLAIGKLAFGSEEAASLLARNKVLLGMKTEMLRSPAVVRAHNAVALSGQVISLRNKPAQLMQYMDSIDPDILLAKTGQVVPSEKAALMIEMKEGAKKEFVDWLTAGDYKAFQMRLKETDPVVIDRILGPKGAEAVRTMAQGNIDKVRMAADGYQKRLNQAAEEAVMRGRATDIAKADKPMTLSPAEIGMTTAKQNLVEFRKTSQLPSALEETRKLTESEIKFRVAEMARRIKEAEAMVVKSDKTKEQVSKYAWRIGGTVVGLGALREFEIARDTVRQLMFGK